MEMSPSGPHWPCRRSEHPGGHFTEEDIPEEKLTCPRPEPCLPSLPPSIPRFRAFESHEKGLTCSSCCQICCNWRMQSRLQIQPPGKKISEWQHQSTPETSRQKPSPAASARRDPLPAPEGRDAPGMLRPREMAADLRSELVQISRLPAMCCQHSKDGRSKTPQAPGVTPVWAGRRCQEAHAFSEDAISITPERVVALCPHSIYTARNG